MISQFGTQALTQISSTRNESQRVYVILLESVFIGLAANEDCDISAKALIEAVEDKWPHIFEKHVLVNLVLSDFRELTKNDNA